MEPVTSELSGVNVSRACPVGKGVSGCGVPKVTSIRLLVKSLLFFQILTKIGCADNFNTTPPPSPKKSMKLSKAIPELLCVLHALE
jgi:hypothetical protein